ncbi:PD-(D/E)XK nuclease family protein [Hymenobacter psychrophilus]|uniref:PD-(D/E)XK nuclease superfamily protein n=1 Tax=Hymenobacter psychrophilus TaxID=651662 RepID=A0A1H3P0B1_9BACT|nr:PD-(D/E)XK nuclease family protein [Hymenobacter psychrophilus]SDY94393.1 PD-(D/E)XK nuclease superfamily protein [Hymenobacter psychrophilus]
MIQDLSSLRELFTRFRALHVKERKGATFLEIARFPHRETVWSNILAFYLDPNREHGLHDLLLRSVLEAIGLDSPSLLSSLHMVQVQTEIQTAKGNRLDLLVVGERFILGIENKVLASLYNDLADYGATLDKQAGGHVHVYKVVLSRYPVVPDHQFVNMTYAQLVQMVRKNLGQYTDYADAKYLLFLLDFLKTIEKHHNRPALMENPDVLQLLQDNAAVVEELVKHHEAYQAELMGKMDRVDRLLVNRLYTATGLTTQLKQAGGVLQGAGARNESSRFIWQSNPLMKYSLTLGDVVVWYQVGIVKGYKLRAHYWVKGPHSLERQLTSKVIQEQHFTLTESDEHMAAEMEQQLQRIVGTLMQAPNTATSLPPDLGLS